MLVRVYVLSLLCLKCTGRPLPELRRRAARASAAAGGEVDAVSGLDRTRAARAGVSTNGSERMRKHRCMCWRGTTLSRATKDYDLFYFDATDCSPEAEVAANHRAGGLFADLARLLRQESRTLACIVARP